MVKKSVIVILVLLSVVFSFNVFAGSEAQEGWSCDYSSGKDAACYPEGNLYCINNVCTTYTGDLEKCSGPTSSDLASKAKVDIVARNAVNGAIIQESHSDICYPEGTGGFAESCSGDNCKVQEYYCSGSELKSKISACSSCSDGKCLSSRPSNCRDDDNDGFFNREGCGSSRDCDDSDSYTRPDNLTNIIGGCGAGNCNDVHVKEICNDNKDNDCDSYIDMTDSECTGRGHCSNNVRDVDESNVDCGGAYCNACPSIPSPRTPVVNISRPHDEINVTDENSCPALNLDISCNNGEYKCDVVSRELSVCESNLWTLNDNRYSELCSNSDECSPGELVCDTENNVYRTCTPYGYLSEGVRENVDAVCRSDSCDPSIGEFKCDNVVDKVSNCVDGSWTMYSSDGYSEKCDAGDSSVADAIKDFFSGLF